MADDEYQSIDLKVEWPTDIYRDAAMTNIFVLSDDGQGIYLGMGHIPPFTTSPPAGGATVVPDVRAAVHLTYRNANELAQLLNEIVDRKKREIKERREAGASNAD
ncbi:hypothetical protein ACRDU6_21090 [Mycolicibacterium sp. ELW1]|uniref:hypothetical protein n=1 Tax=Mycobacteriaceae TaxID=1762 RepID=UPI0011ED2C6E|nr:hypothetical protein [Mycobacterium sp. ELW1]QEN14837.1 hypothetical protein D3H54_17630 [Mycobacterium sp. ELW1]